MRYIDFIDESGPGISEGQLDAFEESHRLSLPKEYREFLLQSNGGTLKPHEVDISGLPGSPTGVRYLFGLGLGSASLDLSMWNSRPELNRDVPPGHIQIGYDGMGCAYTLQLIGVDRGSIHFIDETGSVYWVADDLERFFRDRIRLVDPRSWEQ